MKEIVIKVPDDYKSRMASSWNRDFDVRSSIENGIPLPKGHGRLIDADEVLSEIAKLKQSPWLNDNTSSSYLVRKDAVEMVEDLCIKIAPTIIEAEEKDAD